MRLRRGSLRRGGRGAMRRWVRALGFREAFFLKEEGWNNNNPVLLSVFQSCSAARTLEGFELVVAAVRAGLRGSQSIRPFSRGTQLGVARDEGSLPSPVLSTPLGSWIETRADQRSLESRPRAGRKQRSCVPSQRIQRHLTRSTPASSFHHCSQHSLVQPQQTKASEPRTARL